MFLSDLQTSNIIAIKLISENCSELLAYLIKEKPLPHFLKYEVAFGNLLGTEMREAYALPIRLTAGR